MFKMSHNQSIIFKVSILDKKKVNQSIFLMSEKSWEWFFMCKRWHDESILVILILSLHLCDITWHERISSNLDKIVSVLITYRVFWVLVNVPRTQNHRATRHTRMADRGRLLDGGLSDYYTESWPWTIVDNMIGECHTPCTLKTSLVDF
jgi:hypothetical protein